MATIPSSEARAALPEILDRVLAGEEVTITRHGQPVAVVVRPDVLRVRRAGATLAAAERLGQVLAAGRSHPIDEQPVLPAARATRLAASVRASRDAR